MSTKRLITGLFARPPSQHREECLRELDVDFEQITNVADLLKKLTDATYAPDVIMLDLDLCSAQAHLQDVINTITTLYSVNHGTKQMKLCGIVYDTTDVKLIREALRTNLQALYRESSDLTVQEKVTAMRRVLNGERYIPEPIQKRINTSKHKINKRSQSDIKLTVRQSEILTLIRERGCSNKVIARLLNITESTVKLHVSAILKKYGVKSRTQLAIFADK